MRPGFVNQACSLPARFQAACAINQLIRKFVAVADVPGGRTGPQQLQPPTGIICNQRVVIGRVQCVGEQNGGVEITGRHVGLEQRDDALRAQPNAFSPLRVTGTNSLATTRISAVTTAAKGLIFIGPRPTKDHSSRKRLKSIASCLRSGDRGPAAAKI